jgi:hydrogenase nickel incorporation protein HypA/HybF
MHEVSLAQGILDAVLAEAAKYGKARVTAVNLRIGALSHVVHDSLQLAFEMLSKDTAADGAALQINTISGKARCRKCGAETEIAPDQWLCPKCESTSLEITGGRELQIESFEIEEETSAQGTGNDETQK